MESTWKLVGVEKTTKPPWPLLGTEPISEDIEEESRPSFESQTVPVKPTPGRTSSPLPPVSSGTSLLEDASSVVKDLGSKALGVAISSANKYSGAVKGGWDLISAGGKELSNTFINEVQSAKQAVSRPQTINSSSVGLLSNGMTFSTDSGNKAKVVPIQNVKALPQDPPIMGLSLEVDTKNKQLSIMLDNKKVKSYPIAVGKSNTPTPKGTFRVLSKEMNPELNPQDYPGEKLPRNMMGTRWLGFHVIYSGPGKGSYGIHGTSVPQSIGTEASHGCIRMHNQDVEGLYKFINLDTPVRVK